MARRRQGPKGRRNARMICRSTCVCNFVKLISVHKGDEHSCLRSLCAARHAKPSHARRSPPLIKRLWRAIGRLWRGAHEAAVAAG